MCLFPQELQIEETELHVFGDASEETYAAVAYFRQIYHGSIVIRAVTKLKSKQTLSVPKLELNVALQAARLARTVEVAMTRKIRRRFFWADSSTVRNWISSDRNIKCS